MNPSSRTPFFDRSRMYLNVLSTGQHVLYHHLLTALVPYTVHTISRDIIGMNSVVHRIWLMVIPKVVQNTVTLSISCVTPL